MFFLKTLPENCDLLPEYQTKLASGADLAAAEDVVLESHSFTRVPTGVYLDLALMALWHNTHGFKMIDIQIRGRSSLPHRLGVFQPCVGTVDMDYPGEIFVSLFNPTSWNIDLFRGSRIAQIVASECVRSPSLRVCEVDRTTSGGTGGLIESFR